MMMMGCSPCRWMTTTMINRFKVSQRCRSPTNEEKEKKGEVKELEEEEEE